jgi:hypothetical protein
MRFTNQCIWRNLPFTFLQTAAFATAFVNLFLLLLRIARRHKIDWTYITT